MGIDETVQNKRRALIEPRLEVVKLTPMHAHKLYTRARFRRQGDMYGRTRVCILCVHATYNVHCVYKQTPDCGTIPALHFLYARMKSERNRIVYSRVREDSDLDWAQIHTRSYILFI